MICIYHSKDLDGLCSAAIVLKKYPDCTLIGWDYGDPIPELPVSKEVIMADISFPMGVMRDISNKYSLTWIDHHASAKKEYLEYSEVFGKMHFTYVYSSTISACELVWSHLYPLVPIPESVDLLSKYDTWRGYGTTEWNERILPFQYGIRAKCNTPQSILNLSGSIYPELEEGKTILGYIKTENEKLCASNCFVRQFQGYRALCLSTPYIDSDTMISVYDPSKHDLMLSFAFVGNYWDFSLRSKNDIDCSVLAKRLGGGGHKNAAGFEVKHLAEAFDIYEE